MTPYRICEAGIHMHTASSFYPLPEGNKSSFHFGITAKKKKIKKIKEEGFEGFRSLAGNTQRNVYYEFTFEFAEKPDWNVTACSIFHIRIIYSAPLASFPIPPFPNVCAIWLHNFHSPLERAIVIC